MAAYNMNRRDHDDVDPPPAGQRLAESGDRGLLAGHSALRHLGQAEGALPEDGPPPQPLVAGGVLRLLLQEEQAKEPQVSAE
ncbi:hypothetical protein AVEN_223594-1 [Araneus ventricosus]|uniref:Uncharacterized protein n=1 Tax=Araneus ventricosus TaxID=182803 RepID=A0A4Y2HJS2_ARAVE|nr:hypothetical protein AVEN_223594-1 [Araneus ventricosus]